MTQPNKASQLNDEIDAIQVDGDQADVAHFQWRISKNLTRRIDQYLVDRVGYLSRNSVQRVIDNGLVKVNGRVVKASYRPRENDMVEMVAPPQPVNEIAPEPIPLDIIFEDEHLIALNKQADLIIHPARGRWSGTLVNGLVHYGNKWSTINGNWRPGILHRLDRNTTGIMLVAKSDEAHWRVARQFEERTIKKTYMAVCHGVPELLSDVIDMPIGKDRYIREKQAVRKESSGGKPAVTVYEVQKIFNAPDQLRLTNSQHAHDQKNPAPAQRFCLVKLSPKTGRTHQLRVHMSYKGFPLVGDTIYGGRVFELADFRFERQALHAYEISFTHPITNQTLTLQAPLPPDMQQLIDRLPVASP
ncbi:MAG: RluA family pseudouridine synthase [Phycisphaerales bacterium]|nr:RluA family pseudouridine synthase [Phycisphaerales bacterium]